MSRCRPACLAVSAAWLLVWPVTLWAADEPARFWISASNVASPRPEAPSIYGYKDEVACLHIWAQPGTVNGGAYDDITNPFRELRNLSLNLVASSSAIDFLDDGIVVHNPTLGGPVRRFEFVFDSAEGLESNVDGGGMPDRIDGIQAFSFGSTNYTGVGPDCHPSDGYCKSTGDGSGPPVWLVASVAYKTLVDSGSVDVRLRVGSNGMNHAGRTTAETTVVFGIDRSGGSEPIYNASSNRDTMLGGDDPDLTIVAAPPLPGDYNRNGVVDAADYTVWRDTKGQTGDCLAADGDGSGTVGAGDYTLWKMKFGTAAGSGAGGGSLANATVPEPTTLVLVLIGALAMFLHRGTSVC